MISYAYEKLIASEAPLSSAAAAEAARTLLAMDPVNFATYGALEMALRCARYILARAPGHTDMMVSPESLDEWLARNPPPSAPSKDVVAAIEDILIEYDADMCVKDADGLRDKLARFAAEREARVREEFSDLFEAARGLCFGEDWNNGTHAKLHGYRKKLIIAVAKLCPDHPVAIRAGSGK